MAEALELSTGRLALRRWRPEDRVPFAALNADPEVMRYFPAELSREESDELADRIEHAFEVEGFGLWAVEVTATGRFIGFTGLNRPAFDAHFMPAIEIGWRLAREAWGHGYATEAGRAVVRLAFGDLAIGSLVAYTAVENERSRAVMDRLGMTHDPAGDFDHPWLSQGDPLRRQVLYRLRDTLA